MARVAQPVTVTGVTGGAACLRRAGMTAPRRGTAGVAAGGLRGHTPEAGPQSGPEMSRWRSHQRKLLLRLRRA